MIPFSHIFLLLFLCFGNLYAQTDGGIYNNAGKIVVNGAAYIYIDGDNNGDYRSDGAGEVDLQSATSIMVIEGDVDNNTGAGAFKSGHAGEVEFRGGDADSQISGATTINNAEINISSGKVSLPDADLTIGTKLTMTAGVLETGAQKVVMSSTTAGDLSSYSSSSFVYGNLRRTIASNASTYSFPCGVGTAAGDYFRIDFVNNSLAGVSFLDAKATAITEAGNNIDARINTFQSGSAMLDVHADAEWTVTPDAAPSGGSFGMRLFTANVAGLTDNYFCVLKRAGGSTDYADWDSFEGTTTIPAINAAGRTVASGYSERLGYTSFSIFGVGSSNGALPVELSYFKGNCKEGKSLLQWKTSSESDNDYFILERSIDGENYYQFTQIQGSGNSTIDQEYSWTDDHGLETGTFYRLIQVDFDQLETIVGRTFVPSCSGNENQNVNIWTPDNSNISITSGTEDFGMSQVEIYDGLGKLILNKSIYLGASTGPQTVYLNRQSAGLYFVVVNTDFGQFGKKVFLK